MSLKVIRRKGSAHLYIRGTVRGIYCCETTGTADPKLAEMLRSTREKGLYEEALFGARAVVSFSRAALSYLEFEARSEVTKFYVKRLVDHFGATLLAKIGQQAADKAAQAIAGETAAASKVRGVYAPLAAIMNHSAERGWCERPLLKKPTLPRGKTRWLTPAGAVTLMESAAPHLRPLLHFLLCTGARIGEALHLDWADVDLPAAKAIFRDTKSGRDRVAALPPALIVTLANVPGREGCVFRRDDGQPYAEREWGGGQIRKAFSTACRRAGLSNLTPHDLRHTWATWFYATTLDPLRLKAEGGWATLSMVERYAHLMPSALAGEVERVWGSSVQRLNHARG